MKHWSFLGVLLLTLLFHTKGVLALGGDIEKGHDIDRKPDGLPKGLVTALTSQEHVGGYWVNANDFYWFSGDTQMLNRFLVESAKIDGAPVYISFHSGKGEGKRAWDWPKPPTPIDWQVGIFYRGWGEWPKDSPTDYMVRIDVWDGRQVDRNAVVVPAGIVQEVETTTQPATTQPVPMEPTTEPLRWTQPKCLKSAANLHVIGIALIEYVKNNNTYPNSLLDLKSDDIEADTLICPIDGKLYVYVKPAIAHPSPYTIVVYEGTASSKGIVNILCVDGDVEGFREAVAKEKIGKGQR